MYNVISPDGFAIERDKFYTTKKEAMIALTKWVKRYEQQGYYSSNNGRIQLNQLKNSCKIIKYIYETNNEGLQ